MEESVLKLISQVGLIALLVWVLAAALGRKNEVTTGPAHKGGRMDRRSQVWNQSPADGPSASAGLLFGPSLVM